MSVDVSDDWKLKTTPVVKLKIPDEMFVPWFFTPGAILTGHL